MDGFVGDWLGLVVRWIHVIAAIAWIGHAFFFHSIHHHMGHGKGDDDQDMWMIHGGGFYFLKKTKTLPKEVVDQLLWFKWEAGFTWLSGFLLLILVFYLGGGVYLTDPTVADVSTPVAVGIGIGTLLGGWLFYDLLWASPLGRNTPVATALTVGMVVGAAYGLTHVLSGRAAFLHAGALLATIMAANVWMRIIPGQRKMLAQIQAGGAPDPDFAARTSARSTHNGYMQFPVIFTMISNHYPSTYGHEWNWVVLLLVMVLGAASRQLLFDFGRSHPAVYATLVGAVVPLAWLTAPRAPVEDAPVEVAADRAPVDPATVGTIAGTVSFEGTAPAPKELALSGCPHDGPVFDDAVLVRDGRLANVFVWIREGAEGWAPPPAPTDEVVVDQVGCMYTPHVVGARVGQPVTFVNSDPLPHNVRSVGALNQTFNDLMPAKDQRLTKVFKRPEVMIQAKCDVHPWMTSYVGVVPHPWFAVTGPDGAFELTGVPPGEYVVEAWHEVYGTKTATVTVPASGQAAAAFTFAP